MTRGAGISQIQLVLPLVELGDTALLVGEIVSNARVGVNRVDMTAHRARHQPRGDREVFVMRTSNLRTPSVCRSKLLGIVAQGVRGGRLNNRRAVHGGTPALPLVKVYR